MNKGDLIGKISNDTKITKSAAEKAINSLISNVKKSLKKGESVTLVGFGSFSVAKRKARKGRNPQTGETIKIPAKKVPVFRAGKDLKTVVKK